MYKPILFLLVVCGALASCQKSTPGSAAAGGGRTVLQIVQNSFDVSLFNEALRYTGLADSLNGQGPYTVFAPNDAAFDSLGINSTAQIDTMNKVTLTRLLKYHILYGQNVPLGDVAQSTNNPFINWDNLTLYLSRPYNNINSQNQTFLTVNGDTVVQVDQTAVNGTVHTLKKVLKYQAYNTCADFLLADTNYSYFVTALQHFSLFDQLKGPGPFTVFAPVNSAFTSAGITLDSLNKLDTVHFIKLLFAPYVLPGLRFFNTDLFDFGPFGFTNFQYYSPDNTYLVNVYPESIFGIPWTTYTVSATGFDPVTHDGIPLANLVGNIDPSLFPYLTNMNNPAGNGVVDAIQALYTSPSFCGILQE